MNLTIPEFAWFVLAWCGGCVVVFAAISRTLHARAEARSLRRRVICRICLHAYEDADSIAGKHPTECPNCGTLNERGF